jgi:hypothetical protein
MLNSDVVPSRNEINFLLRPDVSSESRLQPVKRVKGM